MSGRKGDNHSVREERRESDFRIATRCASNSEIDFFGLYQADDALSDNIPKHN